MTDPIDQLRKEVNKSLYKAGYLLQNEIRQNLNTAQPYTRTGSTFRGHDPSKPGEYPKKLSGALIKSIAFVVDEVNMVLTVGTNQKQGRFLEYGTKHMAARPWLLRTYEAAKGRISKLFGGS